MSFGSLPSVLGNGGGVAISVIGGRGLFADGTAAAPSISFASDSDTGFFRLGSGEMAFTTNGVSALRFTASSGGFITNPTQANCYVGFLNTGALLLSAGGTNQNIALTPSTTGFVDIVGSNDASFANALRVLTPTLSNNNSTLILLGKASAANQSAFINYFYSSTAALGRLDFGHNGTTGQVSLLQTGRFLIGTGGTDSGALLQIGTNTTNTAGGMVFGTDTNLFRWGVGTLALNDGINGTPRFIMVNGGTNLADMQHNGSALVFRTFNAANSMTFSSGNSVLALTLDASQRTILSGALRLANAYVAGAVVGTGYVTIQDSTGTTYRVPVLV